MNELGIGFEKYEIPRIILILDCCHAGAVYGYSGDNLRDKFKKR